MTHMYDAFEISPVPAPTPDAVAPELYRGIYGMPAFTAHYDGIRPGLTSWLRRSIDASARAHGIDPDTAAWE
ncbi:hypothetical protein [Microbacterium thalli]|uniref:Uncharacterized protein n=1 Tax=Microbacterium thalli TaxID=3027921 RepID=A0ABT5SMB7_9MICO|nr:hypothetical protein [Microbacterium thalli]MDD7963286.1 hypothetical protein [Microbacterium thalli]MDN8548015.1 hypothetical protein [Microbacterium thalli]